MGDKKFKQIAEGMAKLKGKQAKGHFISGAYVKSVDEGSNTMDVVEYESGLPVYGVLLRGSDDEATDGVILIPEVDSDVIIASVDGPGEWCLVRASKVKKVLITIGNTKLQVSGDGVVINGGQLDGMPISGKVAERLNKLENDMNALKKVFSATWTVVANDGGAALKGAAATWAGQQLVKTQKGDIANDKVKQ